MKTHSASEVTTLWRYTNMLIIIKPSSLLWNLIHKTDGSPTSAVDCDMGSISS